jgi:hypothetical protein
MLHVTAHRLVLVLCQQILMLTRGVGALLLDCTYLGNVHPWHALAAQSGYRQRAAAIIQFPRQLITRRMLQARVLFRDIRPTNQIVPVCRACCNQDRTQWEHHGTPRSTNWRPHQHSHQQEIKSAQYSRLSAYTERTTWGIIDSAQLFSSQRDIITTRQLPSNNMACRAISAALPIDKPALMPLALSHPQSRTTSPIHMRPGVCVAISYQRQLGRAASAGTRHAVPLSH